jgi:Flp pilus assembly protein TadG
MRSLNTKQSGVAMVEMVIVTPLLLLLVLGVAELGKAFMEYNTLNKSVRDAARHVAGSALLGTTGTVLITPELSAAASNLAVYGNTLGTGTPKLPQFSTSQVTVIDAGNSLITVQANYAYEPIMGPVLPSFGLGDGQTSVEFTMRAAVTMRAL